MDDLADVWGDPKEYKGIKIYPVKMKDCVDFYKYVSCLLYEKNKIPDVRIIKMSYLRFLFELAYFEDEKGKSFGYIIDNLKKLLKLVLKEDVQFEGINNKIYIATKNILISEDDFDEIRKIICKQNLIRIDEYFFDPEVEKVIQEAREFIARKQGAGATLEEQIIAYHCLSGISYDQIKEYTIYQFNKGLERFQIIKNFEVFSSLMAEYGKGNEIKHFLCHIEERELLDDVTITKEEFEKLTSDEDMFSVK